jgi:acyl-coenzyme A synthetase/AMP-(fatty) acid ligase
MPQASTLVELMSAGADDAIALTAPGVAGLSFAALRAQVRDTVAALNAMGIGRGDRVAIVLNNGPEMATAFISVAAGAASAPASPPPASPASPRVQTPAVTVTPAGV